MLAFLSQHKDEILGTALVLLAASEGLPFIKRWKGNGIIHALVLVLGALKAKGEVDEPSA